MKDVDQVQIDDVSEGCDLFSEGETMGGGYLLVYCLLVFYFFDSIEGWTPPSTVLLPHKGRDGIRVPLWPII